MLFLSLVTLQFNSLACAKNCIEASNPVELISNVSRYAVITGKVASVDISDRSKVVFLNFGKNYNTSLSAIIYGNSLHSFLMAGVEDFKNHYKNKIVSVEGVVRISNGKPEVVIDSPSQIKVIEDIDRISQK